MQYAVEKVSGPFSSLIKHLKVFIINNIILCMSAEKCSAHQNAKKTIALIDRNFPTGLMGLSRCETALYVYKSTLKCVRQSVQGVVRGGEGRARGWVGRREGHTYVRSIHTCTTYVRMYVCE